VGPWRGRVKLLLQHASEALKKKSQILRRVGKKRIDCSRRVRKQSKRKTEVAKAGRKAYRGKID